ncbi:hypothetical protein D3C75_714400 [compost metagenome]
MVQVTFGGHNLIVICHAHNLPSCQIQGAHRNKTFLSCRFVQVAAEFILQHRLHILILQPGIDQLLLRMVDNVAQRVEDISISSFTQLNLSAELINGTEVEVDQQNPLPC